MAYQLVFLPSLSILHDMFHVSQLKKFAENITFQPHPRCNVDYEKKSLKNKEIPLVMVLWEESQPIEASWEMESGIWESYPYLFR